MLRCLLVALRRSGCACCYGSVPTAPRRSCVQLAAGWVVVGFFNLALEPSHLRHSARVLTTSHVPTHNTCATKHSGLSHSLRVIRIASCAFTFLDAALPVGRTPSQRLCVLLRICSDHSGATRTGHSLARHRRQFRSCLWWKVAARIFGASHRFLHVGSWSRWFGAPLLWMSSGLRHDLS